MMAWVRISLSPGSVHKQLRLQLIRSFFWSSHLHKESGFPDRSTEPGLNNPAKLWWAKEVTPDFHISGRLTERQMKYAADVGFRSLVSLWDYDEPGHFGDDRLPSSTEARRIVEGISGLQFTTVLRAGADDWCSGNAMQSLSAVIPSLQKPVLLQSGRGRSVTFVLLMYLANRSRSDPDFRPMIDSSRFYDITFRMGFDFTTDRAKEVVAQITGEAVVKDPPASNANPSWSDYWMGHPVYKNWFTAGQITRSNPQVLKTAGYKSVINLRQGLVMDGLPSQEEVNLLNVAGKTGTYSTDGRMPRQSRARLEETRVDPSRPNTYIGPESETNYETVNNGEFGDNVGYNSVIERELFDTIPLDYLHLPVAVSGPYEPFFDKHLDTLVEIGTRGPVLVHCTKAFRASYIAILSAAIQYDLDLEWALEKSRDLGYAVSKDKTPEIYKTMKKHLDSRTVLNVN